jgi:(1->4)-alpha-D-glucan 1-alpha-D-glucosylmutase
MDVPRATMRIQFHREFTFDDGLAVVPYLAGLHVSHLYSSPIFTARSGSMHGYDVVDPTRLNPELGGEPAFRRLVGALHAAGLGIIVDIVPNHMAVGGRDNPWWLDVLRLGHKSPYAPYFDIDWECQDETLRGKVLAPVLGRPYGEALAAGEITLALDQRADRFEAHVFDHVLPIDPAHRAEIDRVGVQAFDPSTPEGRARLHALLEQQNFRLAWWRTANDEINWRRFFDVNELAALRVEDDEVFETTHAKLFQLAGEGLIDGVRVDHIDGLSEPGAYCRKLRRRLADLAHSRDRRPYIVIEKILGAEEELPAVWECDGTTGYDFMDQVSAVLHDPTGERPLGQDWQIISARPANFEPEESAARYELLNRSFAAQLAALVDALHRLARASIETRDVSRAAINRGVAAILAGMRVYRSYGTPGLSSAHDRAHLGAALERARSDCLPTDRSVVDLLGHWLAGEAAAGGTCELSTIAIRRFQQLSAPLAAKAVEDTAFYRYGRLLSRVDVGFDASLFSDSVADFHYKSLTRLKRSPHSMLATATHDHKRGEDVRARLAVLSEIPGEWQQHLDRWIKRVASMRNGKPAPSPGDLAMLFQTMVGAWPLQLAAEDQVHSVEYSQRLGAWQQKALREAKLATDWMSPNEIYEAAARDTLEAIFADHARDSILSEVGAFAQRIAAAGAANGLAQVMLKLTAPGVPDFYQGTELWDLSLVDPDNRRPVDFNSRMASLSADTDIRELARGWRDGRIKQRVIRECLAARHRHPQLFAVGEYRPLVVEGANTDHAIAFARRHGDITAILVAARFPTPLLRSNDRIAIPSEAWTGARLRLSNDMGPCYRNMLTGERLAASTAEGSAAVVPLRNALAELPVALLLTLEG